MCERLGCCHGIYTAGLRETAAVQGGCQASPSPSCISDTRIAVTEGEICITTNVSCNLHFEGGCIGNGIGKYREIDAAKLYLCYILVDAWCSNCKICGMRKYSCITLGTAKTEEGSGCAFSSRGER